MKSYLLFLSLYYVFGVEEASIVLPRSPRYGDFECIISKFNRTDGTVVYSRICEAAPILNLVFSGGGARGVAYAGAVEALEETKLIDRFGRNSRIRDGIVRVSGSSAGAITAAFFAAGLAASEFVSVAKQVDVSFLLDDEPTKRFLTFGQSGIPLYKFIRDTIARSICEYEKHRIEGGSFLRHPNFVKLVPSYKLRLHRLHDTVCRQSQKKSVPVITFADLRALHKLDPIVFKELSVTATETKTGLKVEMSAESTPNLEIAKACRASAAIPLILTHVRVRVGGGTILKLIDGSYYDNTPTHEASSGQELVRGLNVGEDNQNLSTLIFVFDDTPDDGNGINPFSQMGADYEDKLRQTASQGGWLTRDYVPRALGAIEGPTRFTVTRLNPIWRIQKMYSMRNIALKVNGITTTDFKGAIITAESLIRNAKEQTQRYFEIYGQHQGIHASYESVKELLTDLSSGKLEQLISLMEKNITNLVFGEMTLDEVRKIQQLGTTTKEYICEFDFSDIEDTRKRKIPCIEDPEFVGVVLRYPPRTISSDEPLVSFHHNKITVTCFEERWKSLHSDPIGKYTAGYEVLAKTLGINDDEFEKQKERNMVADEDIKIINLDKNQAKSFCEKLDSAQQFHTYLNSILSDLGAMKRMV